MSHPYHIAAVLSRPTIRRARRAILAILGLQLASLSLLLVAAVIR